MTYPDTTDPDARAASSPSPDSSASEVAQGQAGQVAGDAADASKQVAGVAGEQAGQVASTATGQAKDLLNQTRGELTEQAGIQKDRVSGGLRSIGEELRSLADGSEQPGMVTDLAHQAAQRSTGVADWLEARDPGRVLDEVTRYARQKPGTFLAVAAGAGFLLGRFGRGLAADQDDDTTGSPTAATDPTPGTAPSYGPAYDPRQQLDTTIPGTTPATMPAAVPEVGIVDPVTGRVGGVTP